ncbi:Antirepressor regulating drug resistance protein [Balamuthia mandrillaris]
MQTKFQPHEEEEAGEEDGHELNIVEEEEDDDEEKRGSAEILAKHTPTQHESSSFVTPPKGFFSPSTGKRSPLPKLPSIASSLPPLSSALFPSLLASPATSASAFSPTAGLLQGNNGATAFAYPNASPNMGANVGAASSAAIAGQGLPLPLGFLSHLPPTQASASMPISLPPKRRRTSSEQLRLLESEFEINQHPSLTVRTQLAIQLGMTPRSVQIWFQNRRAKYRNQMDKERQTQEMATAASPIRDAALLSSFSLALDDIARTKEEETAGERDETCHSPVALLEKQQLASALKKEAALQHSHRRWEELSSENPIAAIQISSSASPSSSTSSSSTAVSSKLTSSNTQRASPLEIEEPTTASPSPSSSSAPSIFSCGPAASSSVASSSSLAFASATLEDMMETKDPEGHTPLFRAVLQNLEADARQLIAKGADVDARDHNENTPLLAASALGYLRVVELLLKSGANVNACNSKGCSPLYASCQEGHAEVAALLLSHGARMNLQEYIEGEAPLHIAALKGWAKVCNVLLQHHKQQSLHKAVADLPHSNNKAHTSSSPQAPPFPKSAFLPSPTAIRPSSPTTTSTPSAAGASMRGHHRPIAPANARPTPGGHFFPLPALTASTATTAAVVGGGITGQDVFVGLKPIAAKPPGLPSPFFTVRSPLFGSPSASSSSASAPPSTPPTDYNTVNQRDRRGFTALHHAAVYGHYAVVTLLLEHGALPDIRDAEGHTPLQCAALHGHTPVIRLLLTKHRADVNARDNQGFSALHYAARDGLDATARLLQEHGARLAVATHKGMTPLHIAARTNRASTILLLLQDKDAATVLPMRDNKGRTALLLAAQRGNPEAAKTLISYGADVSVEDATGRTPFDYAPELRHCEEFRQVLQSAMDESVRHSTRSSNNSDGTSNSNKSGRRRKHLQHKQKGKRREKGGRKEMTTPITTDAATSIATATTTKRKVSGRTLEQKQQRPKRRGNKEKREVEIEEHDHQLTSTNNKNNGHTDDNNTSSRRRSRVKKTDEHNEQKHHHHRKRKQMEEEEDDIALLAELVIDESATDAETETDTETATDTEVEEEMRSSLSASLTRKRKRELGHRKKKKRSSKESKKDKKTKKGSAERKRHRHEHNKEGEGVIDKKRTRGKRATNGERKKTQHSTTRTLTNGISRKKAAMLIPSPSIENGEG